MSRSPLALVEAPEASGWPTSIAGLKVQPAPVGQRGAAQERLFGGRGLAVVVGINAYQNGITRLVNAGPDAQAVGQVLAAHHGFDVVEVLDERASGQRLRQMLVELRGVVKFYPRLVLFYSGHGQAEETERGELTGSLLPQDARRDDPRSFLPMSEVRSGLGEVMAAGGRHLLVILDCCAAGAFTRARSTMHPWLSLAEARFHWLKRHVAAQVLVSAAHDELAIDSISVRAANDGTAGQHSPFTGQLLRALRGAMADGNGDGLLLTTELYLHLQKQLNEEQQQRPGMRQTPMLFTLPSHGGGEMSFLVGDAPNWRVPVELTDKAVPFRGLEPYGEEHRALFFGRQAFVEQVVDQLIKQGDPLTLVTGPSGSGKSSVLGAGIRPLLKNQEDAICAPILRPGVDPVAALDRVLEEAIGATPPSGPTAPAGMSSSSPWPWGARVARLDGRLFLFIDQAEELITQQVPLARSELFASRLGDLWQTGRVQMIAAVRSGYEHEVCSRLKVPFGPVRAGASPGPENHPAVVMRPVPSMKREDLREVIERPLEERVLFLTEEKRGGRRLIDVLLDEVEAMPGVLPLLSLALTSMYLRHVATGSPNRELTWEDYDAIGHVSGALVRVAESVYHGPASKGARSAAPRQATMRRVLLRMVTRLGNETTRRRAARWELFPETTWDETDRTREVLQDLVSQRLVVELEGGTFYELAHDRLIDGWPRFRGWLAEEGERLETLRALTVATVDWDTHERRRSHLWDDERVLRVAASGALGGQDGEGRPGGQELLAFLRPEQFLAAIEAHLLALREREFVLASLQARRNGWLRVLLAVVLILGGVYAAYVASVKIEESARLRENDAMNAAVRLLRDSPANLYASWRRAIAAFATRERAGRPHAPEVFGLLTEVAKARAQLPLVIYPLGPERSVLEARWTQQGLWAVVRSEEGQPPLQVVRLEPVSLARPSGVGHIEKTVWLDDRSREARDVRITPDGQTLVTRHRDGVRVWELETGRLRCFLSPSGEQKVALSGLALSQDGMRVVASTRSGGLWQWKIDSKADTCEAVAMPSSPEMVEVLAVGPVGRQVAVALPRRQGFAALWLATEGREGRPIGRFGDAINALAVGEHYVAVGSKDHELALWDGDQVRHLQSPGGLPTALDFSPKEDRLVCATLAGALSLWAKPRVGADWPRLPVRTWLGHTGAIQRAWFSSDGQYVVSVSDDAIVRVWSAEDTEWRLDLTHPGAVQDVAFSPNGRWLVTGADDRKARLWDARTGRMVYDSESFSQTVRGVAVAPDSTWFVAASEDRTGLVCPMDGSDGSSCVELNDKDPQGMHKPILDLALSPEGRIALAYGDGQVRIWPPWDHRVRGAGSSYKQPLGGLPHTMVPAVRLAPEARVLAVAWSPDGERLVSAGADGRTLVWKPPTSAFADAHPRRELRDPSVRSSEASEVTEAVFSPDGAHVFTASRDGRALLWDTATGMPWTVFQCGARDPGLSCRKGPEVTRARFSPSGDLLATTAVDGAVSLWRTSDGQRTHRLEGHQGAVLDVAFSPDGMQVASGGADGTLRLWKTSSGELEARISAHAGSIVSLRYAPDGRRIATAGLDAHVYLWPTCLETVLSVLCEGLRLFPSYEEHPPTAEVQAVCGRSG